jgi:hypothetical protein
MSIPETKTELLQRWHKRLREMQTSQYEAAKPMALRNLQLGIPVVVLSTIVGTSVFASLQKQVSLGWQITVGLISVLAAVLAGLQTFLRYSEKAEAYRMAGAKAGAVRREIEQLLVSGNIESISDQKIDRLRERIDEIAAVATSVPDRLWKKIQADLKDQ